MVKETKIICIMCPLACQVTVTVDDKGNIRSVTGNSCEQGEKYVIAECQFPGRILTTTLLTEGSSQKLLPVRTNKPVLRARLMNVMYSLSQIRVKPPVKMGQIIVSDINKLGVDVVSEDELSA
jgi:CxxC motif-containing protein